MKKICNKCGVKKEIDDFTKRKTSNDGYGNTCKKCTREYMVKYNKLNHIKIEQYHKEYRLTNNEKSKEYQLIYNSIEKTKKKKREYYDNNIQYYRDLEKTDKRKKYRYIYNKESQTLKWRLFLLNTLKRLGKPKDGKTIDLLGYSAIELKEHIESLFTDGMTWDNYGEWHIDHIKMVCEFDVNTPINIVNALSNLRPLWATTREINGVIYEGNLNRIRNKITFN